MAEAALLDGRKDGSSSWATALVLTYGRWEVRERSAYLELGSAQQVETDRVGEGVDGQWVGRRRLFSSTSMEKHQNI